MKQVVFNVYSAKSTVSCSSGNFDNVFGTAHFLTRIVKNEEILCSVVFQSINQFKVHSLDKLDTINFFLHLVV